MLAGVVPKSVARRNCLLCVQEHADSIALVEQLVAGRSDLMLLRALDTEHGLKLARAKEPDAILIDIDPPGMSALEFMQRLREEPGTATTPILALGADASPAAVVKVLEAGFFQFLAKPLQAAPFLEALAYALEFAAVERAERNPLKESRKSALTR